MPIQTRTYQIGPIRVRTNLVIERKDGAVLTFTDGSTCNLLTRETQLRSKAVLVMTHPSEPSPGTGRGHTKGFLGIQEIRIGDPGPFDVVIQGTKETGGNVEIEVKGEAQGLSRIIPRRTGRTLELGFRTASEPDRNRTEPNGPEHRIPQNPRSLLEEGFQALLSEFFQTRPDHAPQASPQPPRPVLHIRCPPATTLHLDTGTRNAHVQVRGQVQTVQGIHGSTKGLFIQETRNLQMTVTGRGSLQVERAEGPVHLHMQRTSQGTVGIQNIVTPYLQVQHEGAGTLDIQNGQIEHLDIQTLGRADLRILAPTEKAILRQEGTPESPPIRTTRVYLPVVQHLQVESKQRSSLRLDSPQG